VQRAISRKNLWDRLPQRVRRTIGGALGLLPPALVLGKAFRRSLSFVRTADRWSADRSREYVVAQLKRVCRLAQERTRYYRDTFSAVGFQPEDLKTVDDLAALPTITRKTIHDRLDDMLTTDPRGSRVDGIATGGTGGHPLHFYIGADRSATEFAYLVAGWERAGFRLGDTLALFRGRPVAPAPNGLRHEFDPLQRHHVYSTFHMSDRDLAGYVDHISNIGPCFLHVYPSSVDALARFIRRSGRPAPANIRGILAESEMVYPAQRTFAEDVLQCRYFSSYGHTEKIIAAAECEFTRDYHVWPTYGYFEVLDFAGKPVTTPGQRGEIVGTGFINWVVPFIRYRTGDFATYVADRCTQCKREHPIITDIRGHRVQEFLVATDGSLIPWTAVNVHDDTFAGVSRFQFHQSKPGVATLRIIPANGRTDCDCKGIVDRLNRKLAGRVAITTEIVEAIPLSPRGKAIYVDQQVPGVDLATAAQTTP